MFRFYTLIVSQKKVRMRIIIPVYWLLFLTSFISFGQENTSPVKIMFYNVENAFDVYDDTLTDDNEFLPGGIRRWSMGRYRNKINNIYKTIIAAGGWNPPEIIAFCEVENRKVLEDIFTNTYLSRYPYGIIHRDSPDRRGIDVALAYRKDEINLSGSEHWIPGNRPGILSRDVLYVKLVNSSDTIHLMVNHWPSKRGGVLATKDLRMKYASLVRHKADSINRSYPAGASIIMIGDFNCVPDDPEMKTLVAPGGNEGAYLNLSENIKSVSGTYRYRGSWEMIDQVIVSRKLIYGSGFVIKPGAVSIFNADFLLKDDPAYPGKSPFSTYRGMQYQGGFSDHLPVLVLLQR